MGGTSKILCVLNPLSLKHAELEKEDFLDGVAKRARHFGFEYRVYETKARQTLSETKALIESEQPEKVLVAGGDGTVNLVGKALMHSSIQLAIIPLGSANGLAVDLGIVKDYKKAIDLAFKGPVLHMDVLEVKAGNEEASYSFHISDLGLNARLVHHFEEDSYRGLSAYFRKLFKTIAESEPTAFRMYLDGAEEAIEGQAQMIAFANSRMYGTEAYLNPLGRINDGLFEVCIVNPFDWWDVLPITYAFFQGTTHKSKYLNIYSCKKVRVELQETLPFQIDGDLGGQQRQVEVCLLPKALQVVVGSSCAYLETNKAENVVNP